jgi:hypothetical protein
MIYYFTDEEINRLIAENKNYDGPIEDFLRFKESEGHKKASLELPRYDGSMFIVKLRQNKNAVTDFSAILAYQEKGANQDFKLRRYNGKHEHTNKLEKQKFFDFHVHYATQRYQDAGRAEESYAVPSDRYSDIRGALTCLILDCNIRIEKDAQTSIFDNL